MATMSAQQHQPLVSLWVLGCHPQKKNVGMSYPASTAWIMNWTEWSWVEIGSYYYRLEFPQKISSIYGLKIKFDQDGHPINNNKNTQRSACSIPYVFAKTPDIALVCVWCKYLVPAFLIIHSIATGFLDNGGGNSSVWLIQAQLQLACCRKMPGAHSNLWYSTNNCSAPSLSLPTRPSFLNSEAFILGPSLI